LNEGASVIEVKNLRKRFRRTAAPGATTSRPDPRQDEEWFHAVRDVSLRCQPGQVLGLLGPNGAGKTTTLRMLSTALRPDGGSASIDQVDLLAAPQEARRRIGFLSGATGLYGRLTARENVEYFGRLHGMDARRLRARCDHLFDRLALQSVADCRADTLSTGMRQRCAIARTVVHSPSVVILDEPTTGLDVMAAEVVLDFIEEYKAMGVPLIFSTHHLHEVEKLCDRVCVINHGRTVFDGTTAELAAFDGSTTLHDAFVRLIGKEA
jgi:sodium transport system ATP-binding protein